MEPKNLNKTQTSGAGFMNKPTSSYNTIAIVHNRFSRLVSSKIVYSLQYSPRTRPNNK